MFDIALNLTSSRFSKDRNEVVTRAFNAGVKGMLIVGTNVHQSAQAWQLTKCYANCWSTAGVHPHHSKEWSKESAEILYAIAQNTRVVAIGECGLDFYRNFSTPEEQEKAFIAQLVLAAELEMPVFIHCRNAYERTIEIIDPFLNKLPGVVLHCFTGSHQVTLACLKRGFYLGMTGWVCDERRGLELRSLLTLIPIEFLLLETDAPYLLPRDLIPKPINNRNEPAYLSHILNKIALYCKEDPNILEIQTDMNVRRLFKIVF